MAKYIVCSPVKTGKGKDAKIQTVGTELDLSKAEHAQIKKAVVTPNQWDEMQSRGGPRPSEAQMRAAVTGLQEQLEAADQAVETAESRAAGLSADLDEAKAKVAELEGQVADLNKTPPAAEAGKLAV